MVLHISHRSTEILVRSNIPRTQIFCPVTAPITFIHSSSVNFGSLGLVGVLSLGGHRSLKELISIQFLQIATFLYTHQDFRSD